MIMRYLAIALICVMASWAPCDDFTLSAVDGDLQADAQGGDVYVLEVGDCVEDWTDLGGGDHCGEDYAPASGVLFAGTHTNVGTFTITGYRMANAAVTIYAEDVVISAGATMQSLGYRGGGGGGGGGGAWWYKNSLGVRVNDPGYGGDSAVRAGSAGLDGTAYQSGVSASSVKGGNGGNGGIGGGAFLGFRGTGGTGGNFDFADKDGNPGTDAFAGGYNEPADKFATTSGNAPETQNEVIYMGSGGGGGGGGGGGSGVYGAGGGAGTSGGIGGGAIALYASSSVTIDGTVKCDGEINLTPVEAGSDVRFGGGKYYGNNGGDGDPSIRNFTGYMGTKAPGAGGIGTVGAAIDGGSGGYSGSGAGGGILISSPDIAISATAVLTCKNSQGISTAANAGTIKIFHGATYALDGATNSFRIYEYDVH